MSDINEAVADAAIEVAETATSVAEVSRGISGINVRYLVGGAIIGGGIGFLVGFKLRRTWLENHYKEIADEEIEGMRVIFENLKKKKDEDLAQSRENEARLRVRLHEVTTGPKPQLDAVMEDLGYKSTMDHPRPPRLKEVTETFKEGQTIEEDVRNVFEENEKWDYAKEVKSRKADIPYIIHADEHEAGEKGYDNVSLTLYEDDDVLADEDDSIVDHNIVGMHNLTRFGHGSNNPDLLFVRNDNLDTDYEIAKSKGSYAQEVHGFKHAEPNNRRRRDWDG